MLGFEVFYAWLVLAMGIVLAATCVAWVALTLYVWVLGLWNRWAS